MNASENEPSSDIEAAVHALSYTHIWHSANPIAAIADNLAEEGANQALFTASPF